MKNNITIDEICELLKSEDRILIFSHVRPDGDTVGSAFALKYALMEMGKKEVYNICSDKLEERLVFLTDTDDITRIPHSFEPSLCIAVDVASFEMLGKIGSLFKGKTLKIDHHISGEDYAEYNYTEPDASATGEIVYKIIKKLGSFSKRVYENIYGSLQRTGLSHQAHVRQRRHAQLPLRYGIGSDHLLCRSIRLWLSCLRHLRDFIHYRDERCLWCSL